MKKQSKTSKIVAYKRAHPEATYKQISAAIGCDVSLIGHALGKAGLTQKYKRRRTAPKVTPTEGQKVLRDVIGKQEDEVMRLVVEIDHLHQQLDGWKAIVSYLEGKLGIDPHGTAI
jgi:hypothetical protein